MVSSDNPEISLEEFLKFIKSGRVYNRKEVANRINYTYYLGMDLDSYLNDKDSMSEEDYNKMNTIYSGLLQNMKDGSILDDSENSLDNWAFYFYNKKKDELGFNFKLVNNFVNTTFKKYIEEYLDTTKKV
ncbi:MAG: hypothetical protein KAS90_02050 [Candidatus Aenigmarchaeota archaeon]|nr:hypothetical protein [Candidatus Aenigmarchaeota archaeon]